MKITVTYTVNGWLGKKIFTSYTDFMRWATNEFGSMDSQSLVSVKHECVRD